MRTMPGCGGMGAQLIANHDLPELPKTVLVVEDEVLIRLEVADFLREEGYHVIEAANATEALAILRTRTPVDLIYTDVQMPGPMDGLGLARWIRQNRPGAPVIITSGMMRDRDLGDDLAHLAPVQQKPVLEHVLLARIRMTLASEAARATDHDSRQFPSD